MKKIKILKNTLLLNVFLAIFLLSGCIHTPTQYPQYQYAVKGYIPDSSKLALAKWVKETVSAASYHMSGGDYEDPEDVILQAQHSGQELFEVKIEGLDYKSCDDCNWEFIPKTQLNAKQKVILENFKNKSNGQ